MLPWALFGLSELIEHEAKNREIGVAGGVADLSVLASEGVPSFDALTLVFQYGVERVDASRLAKAYQRRKSGMDIVAWFGSQKWNTVVGDR